MTAAATRVAGVLERYEPVIGIEIHCQLRTASKMFCGCSTAYDGAAPNSHVCPVCLGLPGTLPVINRRAVEYVIATGLAIEATIPQRTQWERKNYFYPDLPKGYQISQYAIPLAAAGRLAIETSDGPFVVRITRAHLEEDTAKLVHADAAGLDGRRASLVDFNRSGAPLMEIVTEPDIRTAEQARRYAEELQLLLRAIGVSDADMERGQMRVEANVSLRPRGTEAFGTRVEVKNMNSFRSVERAIAYEIERQGRTLDEGGGLRMETRGWDDGRQATYRMRSKETSEDYRYFPEPDLPPLHVEPGWIERIRAALPELPAARRARLEAEDVPPNQAAAIVGSSELTSFFELARRHAPDLPAPYVANWATQEYAAASNTNPVRSADGLVGHARIDSITDLMRREHKHELTRTNAREVLSHHIDTGQPAAEIIAAKGYRLVSDDESLLEHVDAVIAANPKAVADARAGKPVAGFFVGQVMKATAGTADAARVATLVRQRLDEIGED